MAWAILSENTDLIGWVACMFYGEDGQGSVGDCVSDKIHGRGWNVRIRFVQSKPSDDHHAQAFRGPFGGTIEFPINGSGDGTWFDKAIAEYNAAAHDGEDEFCVAADLASMLAHELVHLCPGQHDSHPSGSDQSDSCTTSYLIESGLKWALAWRYPCLGDASRCETWAKSATWGSDG